MESALFKFALRVYYEMDKEAKTSEEYEGRIFEGSLTNVFKTVGASMSYYSPIKTMLDSPAHDPCITIEQRGNVSQPSIIRLHHPPADEWAGVTAKDLTRGREGAIILAEVEAETNRLKAWRESMKGVNIVEALADFERRLAKVEQQLLALAKDGSK